MADRKQTGEEEAASAVSTVTTDAEQKRILTQVREHLDTELGGSGIFWGGSGFPYAPNEYLATFQDTRTALLTYEEMRRGDSTVAAVLRSLELPILGAKWSFDPPKDASAKEKEAAEHAEESFFHKCGTPWEEYLHTLISFMWAGFSVHETIWTERDGFIEPLRFAHRMARTIAKWNHDDAGTLANLEQWDAWKGKTGKATEPIPRTKLVIATWAKEGDDPRGVSILRTAYRPWFIKLNLERWEAIAFQRSAVGLPVVTMPPIGELRNEDRTTAVNIVRDLRSHERGYAVVPSNWKVELLRQGSDSRLDPSPSIKRQDEAICRNMLAQFLMLGTTETGSRALGGSFIDLFIMSIESVVRCATRATQTDAVDPWAAVNYGPEVRPPVLRAANLKTTDLAALATSLAALTGAKVLVPDDKLEAHVRGIGGLPEKDKATERVPAPPPPPAGGGAGEQGASGAPPGPGQQGPQPPRGAKKGAAPAPEGGKGRKGEPAPGKGAEAGGTEDEEPEAGDLVGKAAERAYREPHGAERFMEFRSANAAMDDAIGVADTLTDGRRRAVAARLAVRVVQAVEKGDADAITEELVEPADVAAMQGPLNRLFTDLYTYGRKTVRTELARQRGARVPVGIGGTPAHPPVASVVNGPEPPGSEGVTHPIGGVVALATDLTVAPTSRKNVVQLLKKKAQRVAEDVLDDMDRFAGDYVATALRTRAPVAVAGVAEALYELGTRRLAAAMGRGVSESFNLGRQVEGEEQVEEGGAGRYAILSALLDGRTCIPCAELDGREFEVGSPEYYANSPPLTEVCEGRERCRCVWVYVDEVNDRPRG